MQQLFAGSFPEGWHRLLQELLHVMDKHGYRFARTQLPSVEFVQ